MEQPLELEYKSKINDLASFARHSQMYKENKDVKVSCKNTFLHFAELRKSAAAGFASPTFSPIIKTFRRRCHSDVTDSQAVFIPSPLICASTSPHITGVGSPALLPVDEAACTRRTVYDGSCCGGSMVEGSADFILPPPCDNFGPCDFTFTLDSDDLDFHQGVMGVQMAHAVFGAEDDCDADRKTRATTSRHDSNDTNDSQDWTNPEDRKTPTTTPRQLNNFDENFNDWNHQQWYGSVNNAQSEQKTANGYERDDKRVREKRNQKQRRKGNKMAELRNGQYSHNYTQSPRDPVVNTSQTKQRPQYYDGHTDPAVKLPKGTTTVMLRNIPNKYTRQMLIDVLNQQFAGMYDFLYLPIDFKNKCNVGYGFLNLRTPEICSQFAGYFHGVDVRKCLPGFNSRKVCEVTPARVQGLQDNVRRLQNSPVMNQLKDHPEWLPVLFGADGGCESFPCPELLQTKPRAESDGIKARKDKDGEYRGRWDRCHRV